MLVPKSQHIFQTFLFSFLLPHKLLVEGEKPSDPLLSAEPIEPPDTSNSSVCSYSSTSPGATEQKIIRVASQSSLLADFHHSDHRRLTEVTPLFWGGRIQMVQREHGQWKDGLFDCFRFGVFHASVWNALCCPTILMAQVLTRLDLNWMAGKQSDDSSGDYFTLQHRTRSWSDTTLERHKIQHQFLFSAAASNIGQHSGIQNDNQLGLLLSHNSPDSIPKSGVTAFTRIFVLTCLFWTLLTISAPRVPKIGQDPASGNITSLDFGNDQVSLARWIIFGSLVVVFAVYAVVVMTRLRHQVRQRYDIPTSAKTEDCCLSLCCLCCSVAQMARQTCDYENGGQGTFCCTPTGLGIEQTLPPSSLIFLNGDMADASNSIRRPWASVGRFNDGRANSNFVPVQPSPAPSTYNLNHSY
ncbi:hypothetical protein ACA910_007720 [Epithemia clementina (nom. ined.)]